MKMKKFDLRKALLGYPLRTRDGRKAIITGLAVSSQFPLIGVAATDNGILQLTWTIDGKWSEFNFISHNDLFME